MPGSWCLFTATKTQTKPTHDYESQSTAGQQSESWKHTSHLFSLQLSDELMRSLTSFSSLMYEEQPCLWYPLQTGKNHLVLRVSHRAAGWPLYPRCSSSFTTYLSSESPTILHPEWSPGRWASASQRSIQSGQILTHTTVLPIRASNTFTPVMSLHRSPKVLLIQLPRTPWLHALETEGSLHLQPWHHHWHQPFLSVSVTFFFCSPPAVPPILHSRFSE